MLFLSLIAKTLTKAINSFIALRKPLKILFQKNGVLASAQKEIILIFILKTFLNELPYNLKALYNSVGQCI